MADPFVAEIRIVGFNFAPKGWAFCDGQLLPLSQNTALFSLLGTTYGGNPLACAAVEKVLDLFEEDHIIEHVREVAPYLEQRLNELADKYDCIKERRGVGLMQGLVFDHPVGDIINRALEKGLILINAGADIIRFVPPLVITRENVDEMIAILDTCIE